MKKSIKKNYIYNLIYQIFLLIVPLVVTPYVSRVLTPEGIGQYSYTYSLITYFTIFSSLGFGYYAQREIAKFQNDNYNQTKVFWEVNICRLFPVMLALILNLILCFTNCYGTYKNIMLAFSINIVAVAFDIAFFFQGNEEFKKIVFRNIIIKTISIIAIFVLVQDSSDLLMYVFINAIMLIVSNLSLWPYLIKLLEKVSIKELKPFKHLPGTIKLFIPTIATTIYTVLDKTLIGVLVDGTYTVIENGQEVIKKYADLENGYYENAEKIVKMTMTIITCIGTVMIPRNSKEFAEGNLEKVRSNILTSSRFVWLIGIPITLGLFAVSSNFVPWYFGSGYDKCVNLIKFLCPLVIIIGFSNVIGLQFLLPSGKDTYFGVALTTGSVINVIMNLILIPKFWSYGAAIGTIVAEFFVTLIMFFMVRREISILKILVCSWKYVLSGVIMLVAVYLIAAKLDSSILNSLILVLIGTGIYGACLLILKDKLVYSVIKMIFGFIFRKKA